MFVSAACASAPPVVPPPPPPSISYEQKIAWILKLEDERRLREPPPPVAPVVEAPARPRGPVIVPPPPPPVPDLIRLLSDSEARVRRRAALGVGRVGLREGVAPLLPLLKDSEPEVRQMVAFALGLIGDASAHYPLVASLDDESPLVKGSAAEGLGLIGDPAAAEPIARMAAALVNAGAASPPPSEDQDVRRDTPAAALRLAIFALTRLRAYEPLARAVLDQAGQPRVRWWPVAYALQRLEDPRARPALLALSRDSHPYTRAFAARGLGGLGKTSDPAVAAALLSLVTGSDRMVAIEAIRALGRLGDPSAGPALRGLIQNPKSDPSLRVEAVLAAGTVKASELDDPLLDALTDSSASVRAGALRALAQRDEVSFLTVLSGIDADRDWSVRASLATVLGTLSTPAGLPRLRVLVDDSDQRVVPAALDAWVRLNAPDAASLLQARLTADDPVVRAAAARGLASLKVNTASAALADAYRAGLKDTTYVARAAALQALADLRTPEAAAVLTEALADKDWAVRVHAARLLRLIDATSDAALRIRPASTAHAADDYQAQQLTTPAVSTQAYIETDRGTVQLELAVLDAPLTVDNFITLAKKGFFDGLTFHRVVPAFVVQTGDPRGDSEGGPGYTIRDELNQRPYVRGTVGMALDWADTGGSQFFITQSPQPHLDGKYTVFGRVLSGMDVVDRLEPGDVIRHVRIWDGTL
jgi:cyclophilin family peptidyl-prolyl cis-trans isomerase/HEAT repeat protein